MQATMIKTEAVVRFGLRLCKDCGVYKPIGDYYRSGAWARGICKPCHSRRVMAHRKVAPRDRVPMGWRLALSYSEGGDAISAYIRGCVVRYEMISGATGTRSVSYSVLLDDSGRRFASEAEALAFG